jgi:hypothetical protein
VYSQEAVSAWGTGLSGVHRTVSGAPGCLGRSGCSRKFHRRRSAKIHRTVWCAPDCPVSQRSAGPTVGRGFCARHVAEPTVGRGHQTVRCAPDCPVRPMTEGKDGLPDLFSTAPSCLGAIKGTPRRMEEYTKHSYNNPKHQDIDSTHLVHCDSI